MVVQHIVTRWEKAHRGAVGGARRKALTEAYPWPSAAAPRGDALVHRVVREAALEYEPHPELVALTSTGSFEGERFLYDGLQVRTTPDGLEVGWHPSGTSYGVPYRPALARAVIVPAGAALVLRVNWKFQLDSMGSRRATSYEDALYRVAAVAPDELAGAPVHQVVDARVTLY